MSEDLTHAAFARHFDSEFEVMNEGLNQNLKLVEVSERKYLQGHEQFSLLFRGNTDLQLEQGIFQVKHPSMGAFDLFLVPIRRDEDGMYYEAIFNRFCEA